MGKCCVYKYVYQDEIIYIGKSDSNVLDRINAHKTESKFKPYLNACQIYYADCINPAHTTILETYFINKYKPKLNVNLKYSVDLPLNIAEPNWKSISNLPCEVKKRQEQKPHGHIWLKHRLEEIGRIEEQISAYKWLYNLISTHCQEHKIVFNIPFHLYRHIGEIMHFDTNIDIEPYSSPDGVEAFMSTKNLEVWRYYCDEFTAKIARYEDKIEKIQDKIRMNEELSKEMK